MARNGAVTLDDNTISICSAAAIPEPASLVLLSASLAGLGLIRRRRPT